MIQKINKKDNIHNFIIYISCGLIGVLLFLLIYGYKILDFTYVDWLFEEKVSDLFQAQIGFEFFRRSSWKFPLGSYNSYPYPSGTSIVFTDSIPLIAIFFKLFKHILPDNFQYFGLWGLICFFLQGFLSSILLKNFIHNNKLILLISPVYICSTNILWRLFRHSSLGGQWIILLALIAWIYRKKLNNLQTVFVWSAITALSVLIHVYFLVMIGIMMCGCLLENILTTKKLKWSIITFCSAVFCTLLSFYIIGGFEIANSVSDEGVGIYSMNLNALFNSFGYSTFFRSFPSNFGQYEGLQYLGAGMILLLFLVICNINIKDIKNILKKDNIKKIIPISIVILILTIIALSPIVVINTKTILDYSHITFITKILGIVRSTGRFFWSVWYMIVTAIFVFLYQKYKNSRKIYFIFGFCVVIQMLDIVPSIPYSNEALKGQYIYDNELSSPIWEELSTKAKHVVLMTEGTYGHEKLAWYAAKNNMTMNIGYFSRKDTDTLNQYMYNSYINLCNENIEEDTIYCIPFDRQNTSYTSQKTLEFDVDGYKVIVSRNLIDEEKYKDLIKPEEENAYKKIQEGRKILMKEENAPEIMLGNEMFQIKDIEILNNMNEIEVKGILKNISEQNYYSYNSIHHSVALYYSIYNKNGDLIKNTDTNHIDFRYFFNKTILPSYEESFSFKIDVSDIISGEYIIMLDLLQEEVICFSDYNSSNYKYTININH